MFRAQGREFAIALAMVLSFAGCTGVPKFVVVGKWGKLMPSTPTITPEVVAVQYLRIDREVGNTVLNDELWKTGDESFVEAKERTALANNGIRVAKFTGNSDPALLGLDAASRVRRSKAERDPVAGTQRL
jgi:hypothetical protein